MTPPASPNVSGNAPGNAPREKPQDQAGRRPASRRASRRAAEFYAPALDRNDQSDLADAGAVAGLDQEIAVLRLRLRRLLSEQPDDVPLTIRTIELLVRAVGTAARLSTDDAGAMLERISAGVGEMVGLLAGPSEETDADAESQQPAATGGSSDG